MPLDTDDANNAEMEALFAEESAKLPQHDADIAQPIEQQDEIVHDAASVAVDAAAGGQEVQAAQAAPDLDLWAGLSEAQQAELNKLRSQAELVPVREAELADTRARMAGQSRKINELTSLSRHKAGAGQSDQAGATQQPPANPLDSDAFKRFQEDYGEIANPVADVTKALAADIAELKAQLAPVVDATTATITGQHLKAEAEALDRLHPDWKAIAQKPEFAAWVQKQPDHVMELIRANGDQVVDHTQADTIMRLFKAETGTSSTTNTGKGADTATARRREQLAASTTGTNRGAGIAGGAPEDLEGAFAHWSKKTAPQR